MIFIVLCFNMQLLTSFLQLYISIFHCPNNKVVIVRFLLNKLSWFKTNWWRKWRLRSIFDAQQYFFVKQMLLFTVGNFLWLLQSKRRKLLCENCFSHFNVSFSWSIDLLYHLFSLDLSTQQQFVYHFIESQTIEKSNQHSDHDDSVLSQPLGNFVSCTHFHGFCIGKGENFNQVSMS